MLERLSLRSTPYQILWQFSLASAALAWFFGDKVIDIQLHDMYIVLDLFNAGLVSAALLSTLGLIYWLLKDKPLTHWMSSAHAWVSSVSASIFLFAFFLASFSNANAQSMPEDYSTLTLASLPAYLLLSALCIFLVVQLLFFVNLVRSFFR